MKSKEYYRGYAEGLGNGLELTSKLIDDILVFDELIVKYNSLVKEQHYASAMAVQEEKPKITSEIIEEIIKHVYKERF